MKPEPRVYQPEDDPFDPQYRMGERPGEREFMEEAFGLGLRRDEHYPRDLNPPPELLEQEDEAA